MLKLKYPTQFIIRRGIHSNSMYDSFYILFAYYAKNIKYTEKTIFPKGLVNEDISGKININLLIISFCWFDRLPKNTWNILLKSYSQ